MLSKRKIIIHFNILLLAFYFFIMFSSCSTIPSREPVSETGKQETASEQVELDPDVSTLYRPECKIDTSIIIKAGEKLPQLQPPESISQCTGLEMIIEDPAENIELLIPEPVQKQGDQEIKIPVKEENKTQADNTGKEPLPAKPSESGENSKKIETKEEIKEYKKEKNTEIKKEEKKEIKKETQQVIKKEEVRSSKENQAAHVSEIYTHMGENIEISFNDNGWIFAGYINEEDAKGVKYLTRDTTYRDSLFTFKSIKKGNYDLEFILQDHASGSQQKEIVRVHVVDDTEFVPENSSEFVSSSNVAEDFYNQGEYQHALEEYLRIYDETSPQLNTKIAELYEKLGKNDAAVPYWECNFKREDDYSLPAAEKLLSYSLESGNTGKIVRYLEYILNSGKAIPESEILKIVTILQKKQDYNEAVSILDNYISLCSNSETRDALYFLLAGLYESNSGMRNLKQAKYYYEKIISDFPAGSYVQPARKRLQYLNRHFFHIQ